MNNLKTTLSGIFGAIALIVNNLFKIEIPVEAILGTTVFFIGLFAKDSKSDDKK